MAKQDVTIELFYSSAWQDVTSDVYRRHDIRITRGRGSESGATRPARATLTFKNTDGTYNPTNPSSALYGLVGRNTPLRITVGTSVRFVGEVSSWSPRRNLAGGQWTDVVAAGITRRLGQGADPLGSALTRYLSAATGVAGYWPLENLPAEGTRVIPAAVGPAAKIRNTGSSIIAPMQFSAETTLPGSGALPTLTTERGLAGVEANVTAAGDPALAVMYWTRTAVPAKSGSNDIFTQATLTLFLANTAGSVPRYHLTVLTFPPGTTLGTEETLTVRAGTADSSGAAIDSVESTTEAFVDGWRHVYARFSQDGSDVDVSVWLDGAEVATGTLTSVTLDQAHSMRMGVFTDGGTGDQVDPISVGHPVILAGTTAALDAIAADVWQAGRGWPGELAEDRFARLVTTEHGITSALVGTADETQPMGPQLPGTLLDLLAEIERTDGGFVFDTRAAAGITLRGGRSLYNGDPALALTMGTDVAPPLDPTVDDRDTRNDVTASRPGGGEARAQDATSIAAVGRYATRLDVNPMSDAVLLNHAQWAVLAGTVDGARYPQVSVDLTAAGATLTDAADAVDVGDLITIDNLEADLVRLIVVGYTETIGTHRRRVTFNCVPALPYQIAEVEHADYAIIGSDGTDSAEFEAGTDTDLVVRVLDGYPLWSDADAPFDILVGGVRLTVTAITDDGGVIGGTQQTFTVNQTPVNGVVKTVPGGSKVDEFHKSHIGL